MLDFVLAPGRDRALRNRHPWLLSRSGEVRGAGDAAPGSSVRVVSSDGEVLGYGDLSPASSLRVRVHHFGKEEPAEDWFVRRIEAAIARRAGDPSLAATDAHRLVNAEGDGLPGLVIDRYKDVLVVKLQSAGMHRRRERLAAALPGLLPPAEVVCAWERADAAACRREGVPVVEGPLFGDPPSAKVAIREGACHFEVDVIHGQKTGFYLDQRDARAWVAKYAPGRDVLDLFCYSGGFATAAAQAGAASVTLVDSSAPALETAEHHLQANAPDCPRTVVKGDAFETLRGEGPDFDLLVVDPPPLARRRSQVAKASRAQKDLLLHALRRARPGALVFAFSCSHHLGPDLFRKIAFGASRDAGRPVQVVGSLGAPSDHPVSLDHPEGAYLTGLVLRT